MSSFFNFDMSHQNNASGGTLRFPENLASKYDQYIRLSKYRFDGYEIAQLKDPRKFGFNTSFGKTIALPLPDNLTDTLSHAYVSTHDLDILGSMIEGALSGVATNAFKLASGTTGRAIQNASFFEGTNVKTWDFTWSNLIPNNSAEAKTLAKMIQSLEYGSLTSVENNLFHHPDIYHITIAGPYQQMVFLPCFITSITTQAAPLGHMAIYEDGGLPSVSFSIQLTEITNRTKQLADILYNQRGSY